MYKLRSKLPYRGLQLGIAASFVVASILPALVLNHASAAQVTSRSITMSNSALGAVTTDYEVAFKVATNITVKGIVVEFCKNTPLPGMACTIADSNGTVVPTITSMVNPLTGLSGNTSLTGTWTGASANSAHTLKLTSVAGTAVTSGDADPIRFKFVATNPSTTDSHSFYARIYTYTSDVISPSPADHTGGATTGAYTDQGGIALSTANQINITTRVQEQLTFCVNKAATNHCTVGGAPDLDIGTGTPRVIDSGNVYTDTAVFGLATNASGGATIRMRGDTLHSGSNDINAVGAAAALITAGTENFGMSLVGGSDEQVVPGPNSVIPDANYTTNYGFDTVASTTAYGDVIATTTGPIGIGGATDSTMTFGATASLVTPAGLYTTALNLIATGTY